MDKKNTIIGVSLLILALVLMFQQGKQAQEEAARQAAEREAAAANAANGEEPAQTAPDGSTTLPQTFPDLRLKLFGTGIG